jgi:SAM-dependent methyltransferase
MNDFHIDSCRMTIHEAPTQKGLHTKLDGLFRRLVPSLASLSRRRWLMAPIDLLDRLLSLPFPELRAMPPARLRLRVGVGNRIIANQATALGVSARFWLHYVARGVVRWDSDVVDIGCGWGRVPLMLAQYGYGDERFVGQYTGIDIDPELISWAREHFPSDRFHFELATTRSAVYNPRGDDRAYALPLADGSQDFVFSNSLFTHLLERDLVNYIRESARVLRHGGMMAMSVFCLDQMRERGLLGRRWTFKHQVGQGWVESLRLPEAAVAYSAEMLVTEAAKAGLRDVTIRPPQTGQSVLEALR